MDIKDLNGYNIFGSQKPQIENVKQVGAFGRSFMFIIDSVIVTLARAFIFNILSLIKIKPLINSLLSQKFNTTLQALTQANSTLSNEQIIAILQDKQIVTAIVIWGMISFFAGSLYYIILPTTKLQTTIGGKTCRMLFVDKNLQQINILKSITRYFLSLTPSILCISILLYTKNLKIND